MGLDILWEDERGQILERCPTQFNPWQYINAPEDILRTCCLRFIDEYGDTKFNQLQLPVLLEELEALLPQSQDSTARHALESLIVFIRKAHGSIHTYIELIGD